MKTVAPERRKPGRPATGRDPHVPLRLPQRLLDDIDRWRADSGMTRSAAIRHLIMFALYVPPKKGRSRSTKLPAVPEPEPAVEAYRPRRVPRGLSAEEIAAAVERAEALSRGK